MKFHVFNGHDGTGAVFRIAKKLIDQRALFLITVHEHALDHACWQFLQEIHGIVNKHIVDDAHGFLISQRFQNAGALIIVHIGKDLCGDILGQQPEHHQYPFIIQGFKVFRNVHFIEHIQRATQLRFFAIFQKRVQALPNAIKIQWPHLPFLIKLRTACLTYRTRFRDRLITRARTALWVYI